MVEAGGAGTSFGEMLRALRTSRGISQAAVATRAGLDRSYVNRIEAGERGAPAPPAVEALIGALQLGPAEADRLTAAAGLLPRALRALGPDDPTVLLLAERLADPSLSPPSRDALRAAVELIVRHWSTARAESAMDTAGAGAGVPSNANVNAGANTSSRAAAPTGAAAIGSTTADD